MVSFQIIKYLFAYYNVTRWTIISYHIISYHIITGTSIHDLVQIENLELNEPAGWVIINLNDPNSISIDKTDSATDLTEKSLRTHLLQVKILTMHQNGRDTHVRQLKVFGPRDSPITTANIPYDHFKTSIMKEFAIIR